jgi:hypothetical protein
VPGRRTRATAIVGAGAALLCIASLAIWWPGVAAYDSVEQYKQVLSGRYDDWHPPVMVRLWAVVHPLGAGMAPMLVVQLLLYWLGLGLIAAALARSGRALAGGAILAIGMLPLFIGWQGVVLKDTQMLGAMLAALGLVAWWRLVGARMPRLAIAAVVILLGYATLVRANAVFATVPLALTLMSWPVLLWRRVAASVVLILAVLLVEPPINHLVFAADATPVSHTVPIFDLTGITHFSTAGDGDVLPAADRVTIATRHCYQPFFWDPMGDAEHCLAITTRLNQWPTGALDAAWLRGVLRHPIAYLEHRLSHLNMTDRLWVPAGLMSAQPLVTAEPNDLGLTSPGAWAVRFAHAGGWIAETPLGWPVCWIVVALTALWIAAARATSPARDMALALVVSALTLEASFAAISIASDLRYHLWSMAATALAVVLLAGERPVPRRVLAIGAASLAIVMIIGGTARLTLPRPPADYEAMLG